MNDLHVPRRPGWLCAGCGDQWPCPTQRRSLLAQYEQAPVSLSLLLASYFVDACYDLADDAAGDLYQRFFGWARHLRHRGAPAVDRLPAEYIRRGARHRSTPPPPITPSGGGRS